MDVGFRVTGLGGFKYSIYEQLERINSLRSEIFRQLRVIGGLRFRLYLNTENLRRR
jgi:hypothetical protein